MKRTSLWETMDRVPTMDKTAKESVLRMLDWSTARVLEDEVDLYKPTSAKGRKVVVSRGIP